MLKQLGRAAEQLRHTLGESLNSIEKYDTPIENATTASLEALNAYSLGMAARRTQGDVASLVFLKQAIELDPNFALAYGRISTVYSNLGEDKLAGENIQKAFALKDRVSEPERLYILGRYYTLIEKTDQKTIDTYRLWIVCPGGQVAPRKLNPAARSSRDLTTLKAIARPKQSVTNNGG